MSLSETVTLASNLIREASVSPEDGTCQQQMQAFLTPLGFDVEAMPFGPVKNLWATRSGSKPGPTLVFAGHTDVVPTGPEDAWEHSPFCGDVIDGVLHGRGAADMKGSLASMMTAAARFVESTPDYAGTIGFLITSDEEDVATDGTVKVMDELDRRNTRIDYCIVGEPSSSKTLGDVVRVGRRGSLNGSLTVRGIQGHVAYPQDVRNPIHEFAPALAELVNTVWDEGNEFFPATSFQISNINAGTGAGNVVPGELAIEFNFRFSTESTEESLRAATEAIIDQYTSDYRLDWTLSGPPFLTRDGKLIATVQNVIATRLDLETELSTSGGTSDGRFIAPRGIELVELGPTNATIHKVNEQIETRQLDELSLVYEDILRALLTDE